MSRALHDAWRDRFRIAKLARVVDGLAGQAEVGGGRFNVLIWNLEITSASMTLHFSPRLRRVVLIRQSALRLRLAASGSASTR